jgi:hypothetical protein
VKKRFAKNAERPKSWNVKWSHCHTAKVVQKLNQGKRRRFRRYPFINRKSYTESSDFSFDFPFTR